jgi:putative endonuclease
MTLKAANAAFFMFTVYVLYSPTFDKTYTGYTSSIDIRLASHNFLAKKGYTVRFRPWELIHTENLSTKAEAIKREKELKSGKGREFIRKIIDQKFPKKLDSYPP